MTTILQNIYLFVLQVRHLEETGGIMADDLMQKSNIIQTYIMENKLGTVFIPKLYSFKEVASFYSVVSFRLLRLID